MRYARQWVAAPATVRAQEKARRTHSLASSRASTSGWPVSESHRMKAFRLSGDMRTSWRGRRGAQGGGERDAGGRGGGQTGPTAAKREGSQRPEASLSSLHARTCLDAEPQAADERIPQAGVAQQHSGQGGVDAGGDCSGGAARLGLSLAVRSRCSAGLQKAVQACWKRVDAGGGQSMLTSLLVPASWPQRFRGVPAANAKGSAVGLLEWAPAAGGGGGERRQSGGHSWTHLQAHL